MSGGAFEYQDSRLDDIADILRTKIAKCRKGHEYYDYPERFLNEMISTYRKTKELRVLLHRMDWVLSGDDGIETYFESLVEDFENLDYADDSESDEEWLEKWDDDW